MRKNWHVTSTSTKDLTTSRELGSKVVQQPEGEVARQPDREVVRQTKFFQSTQPIPNPIREDQGDLMACKMKETRFVFKKLV